MSNYGTQSLSLYDICSDDYYITANYKRDGNIQIEVIDYDENNIYEESTHPYAWDSLVSFARMVLSQDEKLKIQSKNFLNKLCQNA